MQTNTNSSKVSLSFTGTGGEYFRIWIVNLLLTIVTLGIYSAWAKVRRNHYFYSSTQLAGASFEYHGNPIAILKGRIVAFVFVTLYHFAFKFSTGFGFLMLIALSAVMPWLLWKSLQFKLYNSSFRGVRFGFRGTAKQAYINYLMWPFFALISLYTLVPLVHQRIKQFQHNESRFGTTHFSFDAKISRFYLNYLIGFSIFIAGIIVICLAFSAPIAAVIAAKQAGQFAPHLIVGLIGLVFSLYFWLFAIVPLFLSLIQNLIWNHTKLGNRQMYSHMKWGRVTFIYLTNLLAIVCTLGLFIPFAQIRMMRYRLESISIEIGDGLDQFVADEAAQVSATGEGMADLLDFDLSL